MNEMKPIKAIGALALCAFSLAWSADAALALSKCIKEPRKPPYTVAWADIYLAPTWMTQTTQTMNDMTAELKKDGLVKDFTIQNANGNVTTQIQQIQAMIDANTDVIIVDAGSPSALNRVVAQACSKGIAVISFDSPIDTNDLTTKIEVSTKAWGETTAKWLIDQLGGKGDILVLNGPAGIGVSEARWAEAKKVFDQAPGIKVLAISNTEYNVAPAEQSVSSLLYAHPNVDGIWSQGGALSAGAVLAYDRAGKKIPPMTGENSKQFLKLWAEKKFPAMAVGNPNWMGAMSILAGVLAQQGKDVKSPIDVPIPVITNDTLAGDLERGKDFPDDGFVYTAYTRDSLQKVILGQ
jgi:ribose transport system substrate-binding protein